MGYFCFKISKFLNFFDYHYFTILCLKQFHQIFCKLDLRKILNVDVLKSKIILWKTNSFLYFFCLWDCQIYYFGHLRGDEFKFLCKKKDRYLIDRKIYIIDR